MEAPFDFTVKDMPVLRKWWCTVLLENFHLDGHGRMFAHFTEEAKQMALADPIKEITARAAEYFLTEEHFTNSSAHSNIVEEVDFFNRALLWWCNKNGIVAPGDTGIRVPHLPDETKMRAAVRRVSVGASTLVGHMSRAQPSVQAQLFA
ncbi:unnamed protein product [Gadus morhua 'NCC']